MHSMHISHPALRSFDTKRDDTAVRRILALSFGGTTDGVGAYLDLVGAEHMRVLDEGATPATTCLARIAMGHYFGGRVVPSVGIAAVGVAPESRGGKRALSLMQACVREVADAGVPLLSLYASTQSLYRQVGFEQAGSKFETRVPLRQLTEGTRDLPIEPVETIDASGHLNPRLVSCYQTYASCFQGFVDRSPFFWKRIQQNRDQAFHGFAVVPDGPGTAVEGYVFLGQTRSAGGRHDVTLSDCAFTTVRAGRRILGLLRDFTSMGLTLSFAGGPCHPLVTLMPQQWIEMSLRDYWMIRIADIAKAIAARGYSASVRCEVVLGLTDPLLHGNRGAWRVRVRDGVGEAIRCDESPTFRCDIRSFAAIFSGFLSPAQAILLGMAEGDDATAAALAAPFAGTAPWMPDHF